MEFDIGAWLMLWFFGLWLVYLFFAGVKKLNVDDD